MINKDIKNICRYVWVRVNEWIQSNTDCDPDTMMGACCIASYFLYRLLKKNGYSPTFIIAMDKNDCMGHCWVELESYVLDLTPRQFDGGLPDILVIKKNKYTIKVPKIKNFISILKNRKAIADSKKWVYSQSPLNYLGKINYHVRKANVKARNITQ